MLSNKKLHSIKPELFIRCRKTELFIKHSHLAEPKNVRLNSTHYFIMKVLNKRELQQITFNHSSDIDSKCFINTYKKRNHILF